MTIIDGQPSLPLAATDLAASHPSRIAVDLLALT
jgi:hypothetical protein